MVGKKYYCKATVIGIGNKLITTTIFVVNDQHITYKYKHPVIRLGYSHTCVYVTHNFIVVRPNAFHFLFFFLIQNLQTLQV